MSARTAGLGRSMVVLAVTLLLGVWALLGLADLPDRPYAGYRDGAGSIVTSVTPGAPADQAGLRVGDRIVSINGVPLSQTAHWQGQSRAAVGETRALAIERTDDASGGLTTAEIEITYSSELAAHPLGLIGGALLGIVFAICGVLPYARAPSRQTLLFAIVGVSLAWLLLPEPYVPMRGLRSFLEAVRFLAALPAFACLLHLILIFPEPRRWAARKAAVATIYLPAVLLGGAGAIQLVLRGQLGGSVSLLGTVALAFYMLLSMVALIHRHATTERARRGECGLNLLLWGIVLGFGPLAVEALVTLVAPGIPLPGRDYYFLAMVLIPLSFAAALGMWSAREAVGMPDRAAGLT